MKAFNIYNQEPTGSLPPQLFKYIDIKNIRAATDQFINFMNDISLQLHTKLSNVQQTKGNLKNIKLTAPKLFGQDVKLEFIDSGTMASVYKIKIGDEIFALKINRQNYYQRSDELGAINLHRSARNLINKAYIGAPFEYNGEQYSWLMSDFVSRDRPNSFERANEKLLYAYLTKGIDYSDGSPYNFKDGKIIDLAGLSHGNTFLSLNRAQTDIVKKLVHCMRTDDMASFNKLLAKNPTVTRYMYISMIMKKFQMPKRFQPYFAAVTIAHENLKQAHNNSRDI
ncbi:MAG: hypothetical protein J6S12_01285 [Alphaproteobacteria bacterium]|nr:hypothetical protein [Alphaproteobacteria bacterium]